MSLMFEPLRKYAVFEGRARRAEYWLFQLVLFLLGCAIGIIGAIMGVDYGVGGLEGRIFPFVALGGIVGLAMLIPSLALLARRLHDINLSAWWMLIGLIPGGGLVLFVMSLIDGTHGPNKYGEDPKGRAPQAPRGAIAA